MTRRHIELGVMWAVVGLCVLLFLLGWRATTPGGRPSRQFAASTAVLPTPVSAVALQPTSTPHHHVHGRHHGRGYYKKHGGEDKNGGNSDQGDGN